MVGKGEWNSVGFFISVFEIYEGSLWRGWRVCCCSYILVIIRNAKLLEMKQRG